jgi:PhzF family phenazine biosynthesis protein
LTLPRAQNRKADIRQVDVFCSNQFQGNPLFVVLYGDNLTPEDKNSISKEFGTKNTAIIVEANDGKAAYGVQVYDKTGETSCDYHCLIGTAYLMMKEKKPRIPTDNKPVVITVETKDGIIPLLINTSVRGDLEEILVMKSRSDEIALRRVEQDTEQVAKALNIKSEAIRSNILMQVVKMDHWSMIIPIKDNKAIQKFTLEESNVLELAKQNQAEYVCLIHLNDDEKKEVIKTRVFRLINENGKEKMIEDPITGRCCGSIIGYLFEHNLLKGMSSKVKITLQQGKEDKRVGFVIVEMDIVNNQIKETRIGGKATEVLKGKLSLTPY